MKHTNVVNLFIILLLYSTHTLQSMNEVPTLRDLAISVIARHLKNSINTIDATTSNHAVVSYLNNIPQDSKNEITARFSNYRCAKTVQLERPSIYSLLLTRLNTLINGSGKKIIIHDLLDQNAIQPIKTFDGHTRYITALAATNNGQLLISGSQDTTVKIWDLTTVTPEKEIPCLTTLRQHGESIRKLLLAHHDTILISISDHTMIIWNIANPRQAQHLMTIPIDAHIIKTITQVTDDSCIHYGEKNAIKTLDLHDIEDITLHTAPIKNTQLITALASTKKLIATGSTDKKIILSKLEDTGIITPLKIFSGHKGHIQTLAFTDDEKLLASGASDKKIKLWTLPNQHTQNMYAHSMDTEAP